MARTPQVPGAQQPAAEAAQAAEGSEPKGSAENPLTDADAEADLKGEPRPTDEAADRIAALEAENRRLRAVMAASEQASSPLVIEADGPNTRKYKAETKHGHLTTAELHAKVLKGEVKLADHHVLCKDGWYVNPAANAIHNG